MTGSAAAWIVNRFGRQVHPLRVILRSLLGIDLVGRDPGWPWYPTETSWVTPTAMALLALKRALSSGAPEAGSARARIAVGERHLLERRCRDGGWTHGTNTARGVELASMAETTGQALLALAGVRQPAHTIRLARELLRSARSATAAAWLQMGLAAHGVIAEVPEPARLMRASLIDIALPEISAAALAGRNVLLEYS